MELKVQYPKYKSFLKKKNIELSVQRYLIDALSYMALGLFSSLIIGSIINIIGQKFGIVLFTDTIWPVAREMTGPAIGIAIAYGLKAPPLVIFASTLTGAVGAKVGGPVGAFFAAVIGAEIGKLVSKETKIDIIITPAVTILVGTIVGNLVGPSVSSIMVGFGQAIMYATELHPVPMGIIVSVLMGIALTLPISSAAIGIMLGLSGIASGAATIGCSSQMIGFAVIGFKENGWGGFFAQGLGTSMLQMPNIIKNWKIWIPPIITSALLGPLGTTLYKMENTAIGSGMGTSGLVGQIGTISAMEKSGKGGISMYMAIVLLHFVLPITLNLIIATYMRKKKFIKDGDLKLDL